MTPGTDGKKPFNALQDPGLHDEIIAIKSLSAKQFYPIDKLQAHINNIPHVAVSIFIFDGAHLLLQRRASTKYHSGGRWANSVCTHPKWNESVEACAKRRITEELGWSVQLQKFAEISYQSPVGELYENEHVHCFFGKHDPVNDVNKFNPTEVDGVQWMMLDDIERHITSHPEEFSEWFKIYLHKHRPLIETLIS